jgi:predicted enzyme related to lactoylglutathione lyase
MKLAMNLKQTRLVTENVERLTRFYEHVTGASATVLSSGYVEFQRSPCAGLAIANTATVRAYGAGVAEPAANRTAILDFEVDDVDAEYKRLHKHISDWVQPPTRQPWGNRAMLFRDPDGNLVNVFATPRGAGDA